MSILEKILHIEIKSEDLKNPETREGILTFLKGLKELDNFQQVFDSNKYELNTREEIDIEDDSIGNKAELSSIDHQEESIKELPINEDRYIRPKWLDEKAFAIMKALADKSGPMAKGNIQEIANATYYHTNKLVALMIKQKLLRVEGNCGGAKYYLTNSGLDAILPKTKEAEEIIAASSEAKPTTIKTFADLPKVLNPIKENNSKIKCADALQFINLLLTTKLPIDLNDCNHSLKVSIQQTFFQNRYSLDWKTGLSMARVKGLYPQAKETSYSEDKTIYFPINNTMILEKKYKKTNSKIEFSLLTSPTISGEEAITMISRYTT
jgi:hypothetical protein